MKYNYALDNLTMLDALKLIALNEKKIFSQWYSDKTYFELNKAKQ